MEMLKRRRMKNKSVRFITQAAIIAAIYAALTYVFAFASFGPIQVRVSEALCVLPLFTPAAIPGLFVGCLISNLFLTPLGPWDIVLGSLATLLAAFAASKIKIKWLVPLPAVVINAFVVGWLLYFYIGGDLAADYPFLIFNSLYLTATAFVFVGQALACYVIGLPLLYILNRYGEKIFRPKHN